MNETANEMNEWENEHMRDKMIKKKITKIKKKKEKQERYD